MTRGVLHLVVGPSGAGKDTLLAHAMAARPDILFPSRIITRPAEAGGEPHIPATTPDFDAMEAAGAFALSWRAHGLAYGIPVAAADALGAGRHVAVNVSRAVIGAARARLGPVRVLMITASPDVLARRLAARGREDAADIAARLARSGAAPDGPDTHVIVNDGPPQDGAAALLAALAAPAGPWRARHDMRALDPAGRGPDHPAPPPAMREKGPT